MTTTKVEIVIHLDRGDRFTDRAGLAWPRAKCGIVLQRLHGRSSSMLDVSCKGCLTADRRSLSPRLPYKE